MTMWPISTRVNKPENDDAEILEPMADGAPGSAMKRRWTSQAQRMPGNVMQLSERNAEILRLHEAGHGPTAIGRQLGISPGRARQIIERADRREKARAELVARFGEKPDIAALPDDTPIEVLRLCPGKTQAWDTRVHNLTWASPKPVQTLGDLRKATDSQLRRGLPRWPGPAQGAAQVLPFQRSDGGDPQQLSQCVRRRPRSAQDDPRGRRAARSPWLCAAGGARRAALHEGGGGAGEGDTGDRWGEGLAPSNTADGKGHIDQQT